MADGQMATYDNGFYNIGVRPTEDDKGLGGADPWAADTVADEGLLGAQEDRIRIR